MYPCRERVTKNHGSEFLRPESQRLNVYQRGQVKEVEGAMLEDKAPRHHDVTMRKIGGWRDDGSTDQPKDMNAQWEADRWSLGKRAKRREAWFW
ncbi:hypothetical protein Q1695_011493 [Nippostrongylus brasiliensis]|nr:hypothetical protein Q1695_011493 [Nippostrongylus brasiliensis]